MLKSVYYQNFVLQMTKAALLRAVGPNSLAKAPAAGRFVCSQNQNMSPIFHLPFFLLSLLVQLFCIATSLKSFNGLSAERAAEKIAVLRKPGFPVLSDFLRFFESCGILGYYFELSRK